MTISWQSDEAVFATHWLPKDSLTFQLNYV